MANAMTTDVLGNWADEKTEPTDKLTLLSGSIASGESRTRFGWLRSALQHSILLIINPALPSGPQDSPGDAPRGLEAAQRPQLASANSHPPPLPSLPASRPRRRRCSPLFRSRLGTKNGQIGDVVPRRGAGGSGWPTQKWDQQSKRRAEEMWCDRRRVRGGAAEI